MIKFSEVDLLIGIGSYPKYPIGVFNYRTSQIVLEQPTYIATPEFSLIVGITNLPIIVQYDKMEMSILCYEMCIVEKDAYLHKTSAVDMGKDYAKSAKHFMCFGDDNGLYVINDFGEFSQVDIPCFAIKPRWKPTYVTEKGAAKLAARAHAIVAHKMGILISNSSMAFYIKKKAGNFIVEWTIDQDLAHIGLFISNNNGELYASGKHGSIERVVIEENEGKLEPLMAAGKPIITFRTLACFKDEVVVVLHSDGCAMMDLPSGKVVAHVPIPMSTALAVHRANPFVVVGTQDGDLSLIHFEKPSTPNVVSQIQCDTPPIYELAFHDNCIVFQDQAKNLHVVNVEYRPPKLTHYFSFNDDQLLTQVFIQGFMLVEGPRLLVPISRDKSLEKPGYAEELWIYNWGKDKRLHRRELPLPNTYLSFYTHPPMGRWVTVEIAAAVKDSTVFDLFILHENNDLYWTTSIKTTHFGHLTGIGVTKHLVTWGVDGIMVHFRQHKRSRLPFMMSRFITLSVRPQYLKRATEC